MVMGYTSNPVGYPTNYSSAVLTDDENEDELDSSEVYGHIVTIIEDVSTAAQSSLNLLKADLEFITPMTIPHMFWHASASQPDSLPLQFDCLLDVGSHLMVICDQLVNDINLCCHKLQEPIISKLGMQPDGPKILEFHEFIKLKLYDSSGVYVAKAICAVISAILCMPVLLGLPFLKHNNIVIDVESHTAIDKINNFDLIHPQLHLPKRW